MTARHEWRGTQWRGIAAIPDQMSLFSTPSHEFDDFGGTGEGAKRGVGNGWGEWSRGPVERRGGFKPGGGWGKFGRQIEELAGEERVQKKTERCWMRD